MISRTPLIVSALVCTLAGAAWAHSETIDPPPPPPPVPVGRTPPPPSGNGPTIPERGEGGPGKGPTTPSGEGRGAGPLTGPGTGSGPVLGGPTTRPEFDPGRRRPATSGGVSVDHWSFWWRTVRFQHLTRRTTPVDATPGARDAQPIRPDDELWRAEAHQALLAHLGDSDLDVATSCAVAVGKFGDPADAAALVAIVSDRSLRRTEREAAALGLGLLGDASESARTALVGVAASEREDDRLRAIALHALGLRAEPESLPFLMTMTFSDDATWDVATSALSALGALRDPIVRVDLEERLEGTKRTPRYPRVYAAQGLARCGDVGALPSLGRAASAKDEHVRRAAYLALAALDQVTDDALDVLIRAVHREKNRGARHAAALALGETGSPRGHTALTHMYEKGDALDQHFAGLALGLAARKAGDTSILARLRRDLAERANSDLRGALAIALGLGRDAEAAPILREIVADRGDPVVRAHAALALGMIGRAEDAEALRELATSERDATVRREAALALGLLGDRGAVPQLIAEIERGTTLYLQGASAIGLGYIGGARASGALTKMLADTTKPAIVRALAASGLGILVDPTAGHRLADVAAHLDWASLTPTVHEILRIP